MHLGDFEGVLAYCEFDQQSGPTIRAVYPNDLFPEEEKRISAISMPNIGTQDEFFDEDGAGYTVFQISSSRVACSSYKFLRGGVTTLTGAQLVSISFVTEVTMNPFRYKPFLDLILTSLFRIVVDTKTLKQIYESFSDTGFIDKELSVRGPPIRVKAKVLSDYELPLYYVDLEKNLGRR
jgi:hypothetical protein